MATTGHESEAINVQDLKATLKKGANQGFLNKGTCSVAGGTAAKTVTVGDSFSLTNGAMVLVKFTYGINVDNATLSVNSSDAKPIYYRGAALTSSVVKAKDTLVLKYNGTQWDVVGVLENIAVQQAVSAIEAKMPSSASSTNKLVAEDRLASYVASIISALDASYNVTSTDGHVSVNITQADGVITSLQVLTSDIASATALTALGTRVSQNEVDIAALQALYNALQQSAPVIIQPSDTWPVASPSQNVIYRVIDRENTPPTYYADYMWDGSGTTLADFIQMAKYDNGIDNIPISGSSNLVKSGGVFSFVGGALINKKTTKAAYEPVTLHPNTTYLMMLKNVTSDGLELVSGDIYAGLVGFTFWSTAEGGSRVESNLLNGDILTNNSSISVLYDGYYIFTVASEVRSVRTVRGTADIVIVEYQSIYGDTNIVGSDLLKLNKSLNENNIESQLEVGAVQANDLEWSIATGGIVYYEASDRVRTKVGCLLQLNEGDIISLSDYTNYKIYLCYQSGDKQFTRVGIYHEEDVTCPVTGNYVLGVFTKDGSSISLSDVTSKIRIYSKKEIINLYKSLANLESKCNIYALSKLHGKTINVIGDSYVADNMENDPSNTWHYKVAHLCDMTYNNYGINGNPLVAEAEGHGVPVVDRFQDMSDNADYIVVIGGKNDYNVGLPISDFKTGLRTLCSGLIEKYLGKKICFFTPWYIPQSTLDTLGNPVTGSGGTLIQYIDAIEEICNYYSIPVFNTKNSGLFMGVSATWRHLYMQGDNDISHLNPSGHDLFINKGFEFLGKL